jgi:hypothetical protein
MEVLITLEVVSFPLQGVIGVERCLVKESWEFPIRPLV